MWFSGRGHRNRDPSESADQPADAGATAAGLPDESAVEPADAWPAAAGLSAESAVERPDAGPAAFRSLIGPDTSHAAGRRALP